MSRVDVSVVHILRSRQQMTARKREVSTTRIGPQGANQDLHLYLTMGYTLGNAPRVPEWRAGNEFRAIRDKSLGR